MNSDDHAVYFCFNLTLSALTRQCKHDEISHIDPQFCLQMPQVTAKNREEENKRNALLMDEIASLKAKLTKTDDQENTREPPKDTTHETTKGDETVKTMLEAALQRMEKMEKALQKAKSKAKGKKNGKKSSDSSDDESGSHDSDEDDPEEKEMTTMDGQTAPQMQHKVSTLKYLTELLILQPKMFKQRTFPHIYIPNTASPASSRCLLVAMPFACEAEGFASASLAAAVKFQTPSSRTTLREGKRGR